MNLIFLIMCCLGLGAICLINPESAISVMLEGAEDAVSLSIKMCAVYALWLGILEVMEGAGLNKLVATLFRPLSNFFFKKQSKETREVISMNMAADFLGMGGAATPLGIKAMKMMDMGEESASYDMVKFLILNVTSIQLLPTTVIALRSQAGSNSASNIIFPTLISTIVSALVGLGILKITQLLKGKFKGKKGGKI